MDRDPLLTNEEVAEIVASEGLGYAVEYYLSADRIADPELRKAWKDAGKALQRVSEMLSLD